MRSSAQQAWARRAKTIRTAVRLKYSLQADAEIERLLDSEKKSYWKSVMKGVLPAPLRLDKVIED